MAKKKHKTYDLGEIALNPKTPQHRTWNTNADSLCNYMKDLEYLKMKLRDKALIPRYVAETTSYLGVGNLNKMAFPMICFCDIPFSKIQIHINSYGEYGIAFNKTSLLMKYGIQPIHYISKNSPLIHDFHDAFLCCMEKDTIANEYELLSDYLLSTLVFMKPVSEPKKENNEEYIFQNECEWRFVPKSSDLPPDMELILLNEDVTEKSIQLYSKVLEKHDESWIKYEWSDVKYLIVPDEKDAFDIIDYIYELPINEKDKKMLISKIEVTQRLMEDI